MSMSEAYIFHDYQLIEIQGSVKGLVCASSFWITSTASVPASHCRAPATAPRSKDQQSLLENQLIDAPPLGCSTLPLFWLSQTLGEGQGPKDVHSHLPSVSSLCCCPLQALYPFPAPLPGSAFPVFPLLYRRPLCPSRSRNAPPALSLHSSALLSFLSFLDPHS